MTKIVTWTGGCLCGKRHFTVSGPPAAVGYCHCKMCQRATGAACAVLVRFRQADVVWTAKPKIYRSSPIAVRGFCPDCGSPLFLQYDNDDFVRLTIGAFDQGDQLKPEGHYGVESRLPWDDCGKGLPEEETRERF